MDARIARLKAFADYKAKVGTNNTALAKLLGVSQGTLSKLLGEALGMSLDTALAIQELTAGWEGGQILANEWKGYEPARKRRAIDTIEPKSSDSGTHSAVPDTAPEAGSVPPSAAGSCS